MILLIDNYDSFTYNLVQMMGPMGQEIKVFRNDEIDVSSGSRKIKLRKDSEAEGKFFLPLLFIHILTIPLILWLLAQEKAMVFSSAPVFQPDGGNFIPDSSGMDQ